MNLTFSKMHGAGNDFIIADNRSDIWPSSPDFIRKICDRHRGIGGDGLILLSYSKNNTSHFHMDFFNNDGSSAKMCGNGLRCAALFCRLKMGSGKHLIISTGAGPLDAWIINDSTVKIKIPVIRQFKKIKLEDDTVFWGNTGVPHVVKLLPNIKKINVVREGKKIRFHKKFSPEGTNVNFISIPLETSAPILIRTYERGVENETSACGTGIAAAAVCLNRFLKKLPPFDFRTVNHDILTVEFPDKNNMVNAGDKVELTGPAIEVFSGTLELSTRIQQGSRSRDQFTCNRGATGR